MRPSAPTVDVVDDAHAVAQPLGAAPLERLPDGRQPERLAGVDGHVEVGAVDELERVEVAAGREARLGPGDVEADHALVAVADRQLGDLHRTRELAHGGDDGADDDRAARPRPRPRRRARNPASQAAMTASSARPPASTARARSGPRRRPRRRRRGPRRTRRRPARWPSGVCITPTVCRKPSRYSSRLLRSAPWRNQRAELARGRSVGRSRVARSRAPAR